MRWQNPFARPQPPAYVTIVGEPAWHTPSFLMDPCDALDQVACTAAALGWNGFETPMPRYFAAAIRHARHPGVIDVGANSGFYTLLALAVSATAQITAYEPLPPVRALLRANIAANNAVRRVRVSPRAVSSTAGPRTLFVPASPYGLVETSASLSPDFKAGAGTSHRVRATTLDRRHAGHPPVGVLKIDAESHDLAVLRGATALLQRDRPVVFVEVLLGADTDGLTNLLTTCRYTDHILHPEGAAPPTTSVRHDTAAWNHMWVPQEHHAASRTWIAAAQLDLPPISGQGPPA